MNDIAFTPAQSGFVTMREAVDIIGLAEPTLRRMEARGDMPKRVALGAVRKHPDGPRPSKTGWPRAVFNAWLAALAEQPTANLQPEA